MDYEAVVVGAGPAGAAAAYDLAAAGRRVLLIDRRHFPRAKACAGGLTIRTLRRLRFPVSPVVRQLCRDLVLVGPPGGSVELRAPAPLCAMTVRAELDLFCLERARERGADFRVSRVAGVEEKGDSVQLHTSDGAVRTRYVIGADGANSVVRRCLPGAPATRRGFAIEGNVRTDAPTPMRFDFGATGYGYGWLFPKGDHVNVGLYTNSAHARPGREELLGYARARLGPCDVEHVVGHQVGLGGRKGVPASARIALVGDAAGVVDPLLGEGIHAAVASGQAAAAATLDALEGGGELGELYARRAAPLLRDLRRCHRYAVRFYRHLGAGYRIMSSRVVSSALVRAYARGLGMSELLPRFVLLALPPLPQTRAPG